GIIKSSTGSTLNPFRYIGLLGYYYDPDLQTYYVRHRAYNPTSARWYSADPLATVSDTNRYTYVSNSPVLLVDPSGLCKVCYWDVITTGRAADYDKLVRPGKPHLEGLFRFENVTADFLKSHSYPEI